MTFDEAVAVILEREGGLIDNPKDPGGITNFGISLAAYPRLGREGIKKLTKDQAKALYKRDYWDKAFCDKLPPNLRLLMLDAAVQHDPIDAAKLLQKALGVVVDGKIGPVTLKRLAAVPANEMAANFLAERALYYVFLKDTFSTFGRGWMRRLFHVAIANR